MNDFIYVPVEKDEFDEIMKSGDAINLVGGRDLKGEPRWLKKVPVSSDQKKFTYFANHGDDEGRNCYTICYGDYDEADEIIVGTDDTEEDAIEVCRRLNDILEAKKVPPPEPSISPIQEDWKEAVINEAEERFPTNSIHNDYEFKMPAKIHRRLCRERFIQAAEWAKQYIEENIINKKL